LNTQFPRIDPFIVLNALTGKKDDEDSMAYLTRVTKKVHNDSDHPFESSKAIPGVCGVCGWIHPDLRCNDCGDRVRDHADVLARLIEVGGLGSDLIVVTVTLPRLPKTRRGWFDFLR
jgi:hypothetical protein